MFKMAPRVGFEPTTNRLTVDCSTTELPGNRTWPHLDKPYSRHIAKHFLLCKAKYTGFWLFFVMDGYRGTMNRFTMQILLNCCAILVRQDGLSISITAVPCRKQIWMDLTGKYPWDLTFNSRIFNIMQIASYYAWQQVRALLMNRWQEVRFSAWGLVAEWLRSGLQIHAPRFDSGRGLHSIFANYPVKLDLVLPHVLNAGQRYNLSSTFGWISAISSTFLNLSVRPFFGDVNNHLTTIQLKNKIGTYSQQRIICYVYP